MVVGHADAQPIELGEGLGVHPLVAAEPKRDAMQPGIEGQPSLLRLDHLNLVLGEPHRAEPVAVD